MGRMERRGFWISLFVILIKPTSLVLTRRRWSGRENVPRRGGVIFAVNHVSYVDPLSVAHVVYWCRRVPRFMAKSELFGVFGLGRMLRGAGQIPVYRRATTAGGALRDAVAALEAGRAVVIYPEGTITRDPDFWPMQARTGVARLALTSGAPVVPVAQWGAQHILGRDRKVRLLPRRTVTTVVGPPVDLSEFAGQPLTAPVLRAATERVMGAVRDQLAGIRGEQAPALVGNPSAGARRPVGAVAVPAQPADESALPAGESAAVPALPAGESAAVPAQPADAQAPVDDPDSGAGASVSELPVPPAPQRPADRANPADLPDRSSA